MHLICVGISHRTAPVELRERLDFQVRGVANALFKVTKRPSIRESVIVSTCNRAEIYASCDDVTAARDDLTEFIGEFHDVERDQVTPHIYDATDLDAARHLFRVAGGLDSLVIGEPQILGQVKQALAVAAESRTAGPALNRLFHSSFAAGKRVRAETGLGAGTVSASQAAVALARKIFGDLGSRRVLVVGTGEMGKLTAVHLKAHGVCHMTIVSRTMAHAAEAAVAIGGVSAAPWEDMGALLTASDIVITATGAAAPILTKAHVQAAMHPRRTRPLFIIDIAMPRDVEASAGEIEQVFLYNLDDLQATVQEHLQRRASEAARAETIVAAEVEKFAAWLQSRRAVPTIVALRRRFEEIRRTELARLACKSSMLPPHAQERVDEISRLIVEKLLLTPTERLKRLSDAGTVDAYSEALTRLFSLHNESGTHRRPTAVCAPRRR